MERRCRQPVVVDAARHAFPVGVTPIPICGALPTIVEAGGLETERKRSNQRAGRAVNGYRHGAVFGELIRHPRLRIKRIRVVLQQLTPHRLTDAVKPDSQHRVRQVLGGYLKTAGLGFDISIRSGDAYFHHVSDTREVPAH